MYHFSQFKCLELVSSEAEEVTQVSISEITQSDPKYNVNQCSLKECSNAEEACREFTTPNDLVEINPKDPIFECDSDPQRVMLRPNMVSLLSVRYQKDQTELGYQGGCIDEWEAWPGLCPGYQPQLSDGTIGEANDYDFGQLICGCGRNYGGPRCDEGCPNEQLSLGGVNTACEDEYCVFSTSGGVDGAGGRDGYWMCADLTASGFTTLNRSPQFTSDTYTVTGMIPLMGAQRNILCAQTDAQGQCICLNTNQNGDCTSYSGYTFH